MRIMFVAALSVVCAPAAVAAVSQKAAKTAKASSKPAVFYDFKGARLGMTVAEWRALTPPRPDPAEYVSPNSRREPPQPTCAGEQIGGTPIDVTFYIGETEKAANVLACGYVFHEVIGTSDRWSRFATSIGERYTSEVDYKFLDGRLFEIDVTTNIGAIGDVLDGLNTKWGKPASVTRDTTQNKAGATFPHTTQVWSNSAASIQLESPYTRIDDLNVTYTTKAGLKRIESIDKALHPSADKM